MAIEVIKFEVSIKKSLDVECSIKKDISLSGNITQTVKLDKEL